MKWTKQQQEAIDLRDHNILVSAAAGSGKTAVLVERIKQLILKDRIGLDQFLIVTFTNAAASEMKEKLITAITKAIEEEPKNSAFLRKQLDLAANANISTFHSFALEVIRRYFYLTDIEPNFKIGDEGTVEIMKWDVIDQLFADFFEAEDLEFLEFLRAYASDRSEHSLKENLLNLYTTIRSIPHPLSWLSEQVRTLDFAKEQFMDSPLAQFVLEDLKTSVTQILDGFRQAGQLAEMAGTEGIYNKNQEDLAALEPLERMAESGDLDGIGRLLVSFKANTMRAGKAEKEDYELIKEEMKASRDYSKKMIGALKERYFAQTMDTYIEDLQKVYPAACYLEKLILEFDRRFREAKKEKNLIDFSDIEHYALEILEHEEAAAEYREKFACIFIDEYQDSNVLQDTLINLIRRENNLFMVGDIKQSIYKFRLAEPEIFQEKYREYAAGENEASTKIDLNQNFRSKGQVIAAVNGVFENIMKGYDQDAALYQGVAYTGELDYRTQLHVVDSRVTEDMDLDEDVAEMKNAQLEAYNAAGIIRELLGKPIFDAKKNCQRSVTKRDIVILMRGTKNYADVFQEVFTELDIPSYVDDSGGYFDTVEIQVFLNLLRVIDNKRQDLPLLSVLRSAIFHFSIDELIRIRLAKKEGSYFEAFKAFAEKTGPEEALSRKCADVLEKIGVYREMAQVLPLEEFIWKLMWETEYYTYCGALPAGQQRQANLRALADKARAFQETGRGGIYGFLTYVQALENRKVPTGQVKLINENDDIVRIMTIHKSKGLEFPVVIVAGLGKRFNFNKTGKGFLAHKDLGLGLTRVEHREHWYRKTIMQTAIERKMRQEDLEEEIRILYVAFTRAMDQLILLGTSKTIEDGQPKASPSKSCFLDYLIPLIEEGQMDLYLHDRTQLSGENWQRGQNREKVRELFLQSADKTLQDETLYQELERRFSFQYENLAALSKKSKYSVTELSRMGNEHEETEIVLRSPAFMQGSQEFTAAQRGTIMHKVMECIDFKETLDRIQQGEGVEYVRSQVKRMEDQELLLAEEAQAVECDKIAAFFQSDIGVRAARAEKLYKETEFNLLKEVDGTEVMVQGVIDCYFEEEDHLVLIDYKNSYVNQNDRENALRKLKETYAGQVRIYKEALEVIRQKKVAEACLYLFSENDCISYHTNDN
ncbi:helicase-exonuclease AddAB subunit AddA [Anaerovorax odorimutans]|uniref:DNA 3'-5' helicase n=1 Tax=Anaerovorax odorimutans TaxID=109327 RepID=A0ABT1RM64_9FIRM|nr:helicase-exonuclease AddAB subunit AddA [Anaerovorax odorimutans]MCQ4636026.1 helicase-exonuclease AddAB subunit AddA [Anaerovorax odorimutans]